MPFDNIKTRIQSAAHVRQSMLDCASNIARKEGVIAFWRGTTPRLIRLMVSGIMALLCETICRANPTNITAFKWYNVYSV
jgi:solute carrier family 25 citrate transporter 1